MEISGEELQTYCEFMEHISLSDGYISGLVPDKHLENVINHHCIRTNNYYVSCHVTNFQKRHSKNPGESSRIMWQYKSIPFTGIPFQITMYKERYCQHSALCESAESTKRKKPRRKLADNKDSDLQAVEEDHSYKSKSSSSGIKKSVCQGRIKIRELIRYPECRIEHSKNTRTAKFSSMDKLKAALAKGDQMKTDTVYYLCIPLPSSHNHASALSMHPLVLDKIQSLVSKGFTDPPKVKMRVKNYVNQLSKDKTKFDQSLFSPGLREVRRVINQMCEPTNKIEGEEEADQGASYDNIVIGLAHTDSLSSLLGSQNYSLCTISDAEADKVTVSITQQLNTVESNIAIDELKKECELANVVFTEVTLTEPKEMIVEDAPDIENSFVDTIQEKLNKIQNLDSGICDHEQKSLLMKALNAQIDTFLSSQPKQTKVPE